MVYIPYQELGICPYWAVRKLTCRNGDRCTLKHPSRNALDALEDAHRPRPRLDGDAAFSPASSANPFINGSRPYIFVWGKGNELCGRCGEVGHLPSQCGNEPLHREEQTFLSNLIRDEINRAKAQKGLSRNVPVSALASFFEADNPSKGLAHPPSIQGGNAAQDRVAQASSVPDLQNECRTIDHSQPQHAFTGANAQPLGNDLAVRSVAGQKRNRSDVDLISEPYVSLGSDSMSIDEDTPPQLPPRPDGVFGPTSSAQLVMGGATKRLSSGEAKSVGPHPSIVKVSASYLTQAAIDKCLQPSESADAQERSLAEAREDSVRLQGVTWIDQVRRALSLPAKTYSVACVVYHKFRLAHPSVDYNWADAAAAALLTACKIEDTLKKSKDILAAAYNLKLPPGQEQLSADDSIFETPARVVIGLERLVLEAIAFDFRTRSPHGHLVKVAKSLPKSDDLKETGKLAWTIMTDLHRTFAPLKQTSSTLSLACLELAAHLMAATSDNNTSTVRDNLQAQDYQKKWFSSREEVMETLLDALDLYTHHTAGSILGTKYSLDDFLRIRLAYNKECADSNLPRYTTTRPPPSPDNSNGVVNSSRLSNGHPTPVSPPQPGTQAPHPNLAPLQPPPEGGGTLRFVLNPTRAVEERAEVNRYYVEEWEEYDEEIEVPIPRAHSRDRDRERPRDFLPDRPSARDRSDRDRFDGRRSVRSDRDDRSRPPSSRGLPPPPPPPPLDRDQRDRASLREREHEAERERARLRDRERERRYDDRRYDDRERDRDRRYDDRRDRDRDRDRRSYYDDDRRRGRDDRR